MMILRRLAIKYVAMVANAATLTELNGMRMAEIIGVSLPEAAKEIPTTLYKKEIAKPARTILYAVLLKRMNLGISPKLSESRIASQAGEK